MTSTIMKVKENISARMNFFCTCGILTASMSSNAAYRYAVDADSTLYLTAFLSFAPSEDTRVAPLDRCSNGTREMLPATSKLFHTAVLDVTPDRPWSLEPCPSGSSLSCKSAILRDMRNSSYVLTKQIGVQCEETRALGLSLVLPA